MSPWFWEVKPEAVADAARRIFDACRREQLAAKHILTWARNALPGTRLLSRRVVRAALVVLSAPDTYGRSRMVVADGEKCALGPEFAFPDDFAALVELVAEKFPVDSQSNPMFFSICEKLFEDCGQPRAGAVWYAMEALVRDGVLEKLAEGEEYARCR